MLFNTWKHHSSALLREIRKTMQAGASALDGLADRLIVIGTELMDLYTGRFTPSEIGSIVLAPLRAEDHLALPAFRGWLFASGGYVVLTFAEDDSRSTCRVRANVLKTAMMVLAQIGLHGGDAMELARVNAVRTKYLRLAPIGRDLSATDGPGALIRLLRSEPREG